MEPIIIRLREVLSTLQIRTRKWAKKLRARSRKLERTARARLRALDPRTPRRGKKGRFVKKAKTALRPVPAAA